MNASPSLSPTAEGERRKLGALALLETRREVYVNRGRRALLQRLLAAGTATADDVRAAVELPAGIGPRCFGAVFPPLARARIIRRAGFVVSRRPARHAGITAEWELADRDAAIAWLRDHPDRADPERAEGESAPLRQSALEYAT